jgi:hypothetical protein
MSQVVAFKTKTGLLCSECGAEVKAACSCNAPYIPAGTKAMKAIAANPEKSDRAIAADLGISQPTVSKARKAGDNKLSPAKRIGKDGKRYSAKRSNKKINENGYNKLQRTTEEFMNNFIKILDKWLNSNPPQDHLLALSNTLNLCSEELERLANIIQRRGDSND